MPPFRIRQTNQDGALALSWAVMPHARAYFLGAMGNNTREDMVIWTSSEQPDTGFGLLDYQTNPAVDRWLGEKVLLSEQLRVWAQVPSSATSRSNVLAQ